MAEIASDKPYDEAISVSGDDASTPNISPRPGGKLGKVRKSPRAGGKLGKVRKSKMGIEINER